MRGIAAMALGAGLIADMQNTLHSARHRQEPVKKVDPVKKRQRAAQRKARRITRKSAR